MNNSEKIIISQGESSDLIGKIITKGIIASIIIFISAVIRIIQTGFNNNLLLLIIGAFLSGISIFSYPLVVHMKERHNLLAWIIVTCGWIPYIFGCYLVFYKGFWGFTLLTSGFSTIIILKSLLFIVLGYTIVSSIYKATEFVKAVDENKIAIK